MLPYSFLPSMAAPRLRDAAEKVNGLALKEHSSSVFLWPLALISSNVLVESDKSTTR